MRTFYRALRILSVITLFFFCWTFLPLWQAVAWAAEQKQGQVPTGSRIPDTVSPIENKQASGIGHHGSVQGHGERFEKALEHIREKSVRAHEKHSRGEDTKSEIDAIKAKKAELESIDSELKTEFAATEKKLKDAKLPKEILDRHKKFVKHYEDNLRELKTNLDDVDKAKTGSARAAKIQKMREHLEKVKAPNRHKALDPNNLPHRTVKAKKEKAPRLKREDFERDFPKQKKHKNLATDERGWARIAQNPRSIQFSHELTRMSANVNSALNNKPVMVAANGSLAGLLSDPKPEIRSWPSSAIEFALNSELSTLNYQIAQAMNAPSADDLMETPEVQFTTEIRALAAQLEHNPTKIYNWVRNNIEFAPTYGSMQGADMCRQTMQCNAFDTASLLIALLRASNISAHYVYGTIEVPADRFMNWVGGFSDMRAAIRFVATAGIPIKPITSGGVVTNVQLEHPWVEAWIDYNPSRGEKHHEGDTWIPLDASYKQHLDTAGIDVARSVPFDASSFLPALQAGASADEQSGSIVGGTCSASGQLMQNYRSLVNNHLTQQQPNATMSDVLGKKTIIKEEFSYLLGTLPYRVSTAGARIAALPDTLSYNAAISLGSGMDVSFSFTRSLAELMGKKITLAYVPATQADQNVIARYLPQTSGGIDLTALPAELPAYLIYVKPELRVNGTVVASGPATGLGANQTLTLSFMHPDQNAETVVKNVVAGEFLVLDLNLGSASLNHITALQAKISDTRAKLDANTSVTREEALGDALLAAAVASLTERGTREQLLGRSFGVRTASLPATVLVTAALETTWSFGLPLKIKAAGINLDFAKDDTIITSFSNDSAKEQQFAFTFAMDGSALSQRALDGLFAGNATSTVRSLQSAKETSVPIHTITQQNIAAALPLLSLDTETITDIQNAVNAGMVVVTTRTPLAPGSMVIIDPTTGNSAYAVGNDIQGSVARPAWSVQSPVLHLAWDGLMPRLGNAGETIFSDAFLSSCQAVANGIADFSNSVPGAHINLLTQGEFYKAAMTGMGCYLNNASTTPSGSCMTVYTGSLCIADSSDPLGTPNARPTAEAGAGRNVLVGESLILNGSASTDPNNDPLTYSWTIFAKPTTSKSLLLNPASVTASFTPDVPGTYTFQLVVSDNKSHSDPALVTMIANYETVSVPRLGGMTQSDAEDLIIASHLAVGAISQASSNTVPSGTVLSQDPAANALAVKGSPVKIILSSGPATDTEKPVVTATFDRTPAAYAAGETATLYIEASDNSNTVNVTITMDGVTRTVAPPSTTINTTGFAPGSVHAIEVRATDPSHNTATVSLNLGISDPTNTTGPTAVITTPAPDAEVGAPVSIIGTVNSARLLEYTLSYAPKGTNTYIEFSKGTTPVTNGIIGTFDPSLLKNGIYDIRLLARDTNGRSYGVDTTWRITGDMKVGNFTVTFTDLAIPMAGLPLTVSRTYDSRDKTSKDFGFGWTVDIQNIKIDENRIPGEGWPQNRIPGGWLAKYCLQGDTEHYVSIALPDGRTEEFDVTLTPNCQSISPLQQTMPGFAARPGTTSTLALKNAKLLLVSGEQLLDPDTIMPFDPSGYILTTQDGTKYELDQSYGIQTITDPNGNKLTYGKDGITHTAGAGVKFVRDSKNRIVQIISPDGSKINYAYNSKGELSSVTDALGNITTYTYNRSHGLTSIKDPRGITPVKNEYDDAGRLLAHIDSYGNRIEYTHNITGRQEVVKDRNGNLTVYIYDEKGRVLQKTDPKGNTTSFTYDVVGNKLSETNPLGNTTRWTYDSKKNVLTEAKIISNQTFTTGHTYNSLGKVLTTTDPLGHVTTNTYDAKGNLLTATDAAGNTTTNTYDARGNLLTTKDALSNTTTYEYDAFGNRTKQTTASGAVTTWTYDAKGNKLTEKDPRGNTTTYTYDANSKLLTTTSADGSTIRYEYDKAGNKISETNPLGYTTWYYYDSANRLTSTEYPDGTTVETVYDKEGNRVASIDQENRTTTYEYDGNKQLIKTTYADGTTRSFGYDAAGRQTTVTDALGNVTTKEYDALGRVAKNIDADNNTTTFEYDFAGNQTKQTDANGHATTFAYDQNNRLTTTTLHGGQQTTVEYDALGRKAKETDAAGNKTQFEYDAQGNLVKVTDAEGNVTKYEYDANNNRTAIVDARNNRMTFAYDNLNRLISKTMPNSGIETYAYDAAGRQITKTDAKGQAIQYAYDALGRLVTRAYPDNSITQFTYTQTGKRAAASDKRGTTNYTYDTRGRLAKLTYPDGKAINYGYDANSRISALKSSLTGTVSYVYYNSGRLKEVHDPDGNVSTYTYDNAGNRTGLAYPNGTSVSYTYDNNNRLTNLTHRNTVGVMASYAYTLGAIGNRTRIDEANGISRQYTYDRIYRLTQEKITDPTNAQTYQNDFSYDAVGNRLNKTNTLYNQPAVSNDYTYNVVDQLITENGVTYAYDLNGNLSLKSDATGTTTYTYNYDNRLVQVRNPQSALVNYDYDADGNRVAATTSAGTVRYLVDTNRALSQVLVEYTPSSVVNVSYVYADDLISMNRSDVISYYHFDGLGSTRLLTDEGGVVTDSYEYDAFGNQIARTGTTVNEFLFTGQQYDANVGFYHLRARYYQSTTGRFISTDPFAGDPYAPMSLHKYLYTTNDPVNMIDPSGMMSFSLSGMMASVSIFETLTQIAFTSVLPGLAILNGIDIFWKPGLALRHYALCIMASNIKSAKAYEASIEMYQKGTKLIEMGAFRIEKMIEIIKKIEDTVGLLKFANALRPTVGVANVTVTRFVKMHEQADREIVGLLGKLATTGGGPATTNTYQVIVSFYKPRFINWAEVVGELAEMLIDEIQELVSKH